MIMNQITLNYRPPLRPIARWQCERPIHAYNSTRVIMSFKASEALAGKKIAYGTIECDHLRKSPCVLYVHLSIAAIF